MSVAKSICCYEKGECGRTARIPNKIEVYNSSYDDFLQIEGGIRDNLTKMNSRISDAGFVYKGWKNFTGKTSELTYHIDFGYLLEIHRRREGEGKEFLF